MGRLIIVKTSLFEGDLEELKEKTGKSTNKDAIAMAIAHYNRCSNVKDKRERCIEKKERNRAGRKPSYLAKLKTV